MALKRSQNCLHPSADEVQDLGGTNDCDSGVEVFNFYLIELVLNFIQLP